MKSLQFLLIVGILLLTGCSTFEVGIEHTPDGTETMHALQTAQARLTQIALEPTATQIPPTATAVPPTPVPETATAAAPQTVQFILIALNDNGKSGSMVGCGDSAVPVQVQIQPTQGVLRAALEALLAIKQQFYGESGLYNSLYQATLTVDSVKIENGRADIRLKGSLLLGGECDNPRVQAQLEGTALQFSTVTSADIYINDVPLKQALSLK